MLNINAKETSTYLRFIHNTGLTRHPGGLAATDLLLKKAGLQKNSHLLDIGCGIGHSAAYIAKNYGCRLTCLDRSEKVLNKARSFYEGESFFKQMQFKLGDANSLAFDDQSFDFVLCESVLFFTDNKLEAIKEMGRVIKTGGYLAINEACIDSCENFNAIKKYYAQADFGGYLEDSKLFHQAFSNKKKWQIMLEDISSIDLKTQAIDEIKNLFTPKGILQALEMSFSSFTDPELRNDLTNLIKLALTMPEGAISQLSKLLILAQKL